MINVFEYNSLFLRERVINDDEHQTDNNKQSQLRCAEKPEYKI